MDKGFIFGLKSVGDTPIIEFANGQICEQGINLTLNYFAIDLGIWFWELFATKLPNSVLLLIVGMLTPRSQVGKDVA